MSVLIKGMEMEMPRNCWECEFNKSTLDRMDFCTLTNKQYNWGLSERPSDCPLIEIPPHGRLIDADVLMLMIKEYIDEYGWDVDEHGFHSEKWCAMKETEMAINDAPTVIPADKDGGT